MTAEEIKENQNDLSWMVVNGFTDYKGNEIPIYIFSYYWVFEVITTVGYGDYTGKTVSEYGFSIVLEFVGLSFFSLLMGFMTYVFGTRTSFDSLIEEQMDKLDIWIKKIEKSRKGYHLKPELYENIYRYVRDAFLYDFNMLVE
mmetsp:Transcript_2335/g.1630  ORF Transcript_2335/g.1630 Transcript_2335/m.1630 type:complete len:143 (-) Transcript_2335:1222-1650(-)|eukprot:CAMPEP_0116874198 /NCGR_PEP_ID=MMETSP0463-20121206/5630_1 /TAXON_ID=181622 /ORGANISM="Strombidinopsis sp, Strain SopsisLIS2011" /LENGTH=142 /DNA_ID=CAMNT_0004517543 /DNA_START=1162 /DNA_END=1590 /DNA_ORIENTATION=+